MRNEHSSRNMFNPVIRINSFEIGYIRIVANSYIVNAVLELFSSETKTSWFDVYSFITKCTK